jgi:hypothetical protein
MHTFIDESGIFSNPSNKTNIASVVAALSVPTTRKKELFRRFKELTTNWTDENGEVKGKNLDEEQIATIVSLLQKFDVILEMDVIDLGLHPEDEIDRFKRIQADQITAGLTPAHHSDIVRTAEEIRKTFLAMPTQLYIQALIMFFLIPRILLHGILYYARRIPRELSWFYWMVDAKDESITAYEKAWSTALYPIMSGQSAKNPIQFVEGGDYSYFERFEKSNERMIKEIEQEKGLEAGSIMTIRLGDVFGKHFQFQDSRYNVGLQMADILANATQRALNGKLDIAGWGDIGSLMIIRNPNVLDFIKIDPDKAEDEEAKKVTSPFYGVLQTYKARAKSMWLPSDLEQLRREATDNSKRNS